MYVVVTSDGAIHETDSAEQFVAWLDEFGAEVVDHAAPNEQWTDLSRALMRDQGGPGVGDDGFQPFTPGLQIGRMIVERAMQS